MWLILCFLLQIKRIEACSNAYYNVMTINMRTNYPCHVANIMTFSGVLKGGGGGQSHFELVNLL